MQESGRKITYVSNQPIEPMGLNTLAPQITMQDRARNILSIVAECRTRIANVSEKIIGPCPQAEQEGNQDPSLNSSLIIAGLQLDNLLADIARIVNLL